MQEKGMENDPRYSQLFAILQGRPPMMDMQDNTYGMGNMPSGVPPMHHGDMGPSGLPGPSNMPDNTQRISQKEAIIKEFNSQQLLQLRAQIMAYKLISRNQPLPDHVKIAMLGKQTPKITMQSSNAPSSGVAPANTSQGAPQGSTLSQPPAGATTSVPNTSVAPNQTAYNVPGMTPCKLYYICSLTCLLKWSSKVSIESLWPVNFGTVAISH
jgi:SWI/SNF-related matrix-associated actin-dependent regulator of chromatin subfamily A protein 2/4